ncbi:MAG: formate dehydrogenase accessory sulfurtransferase FdhD, partial [Luteimonas sp.]
MPNGWPATGLPATGLPATGLPATGLQSVEALHVTGDASTQRTESVVEETPVALLYNGDPFAVMMATPMDLEDFALGFALTEGIVASADEFKLVDLVRNAQGIALHGAIPQSRFDALGERRRNLEGRSGCGLCGVESLDAAIRPVRRVTAAGSTTGGNVSVAQIRAGLDRLAQHQPLNAASGGVHAAGYAHADGIVVREDVGRHNALDKLVGALAVSDRRGGFLVITSRASYEIVHKAAMADIAVVVAISAPTALAIRLAQQANITLVAFARGDTMNIYSGSGRIVGGASAPT